MLLVVEVGWIAGARGFRRRRWNPEALFVERRLLPALALGGLLVALSRRLPPSESLEAALGATVVTALALVLLRGALRVWGGDAPP